VLPQGAKLGLTSLVSGDTLTFGLTSCVWNFEIVSLAHFLLSGLLALAAVWHWAIWDLSLFTNTISLARSLDLPKIFGIHLALASFLCYTFGLLHLGGVLGPGMWSSDDEALAGLIRSVIPSYSILGLTPYSTGSIVAHHAIAGILGLGVSFWHISSRPGPTIYNIFRLNSIEGVLSSSIVSVLWTAGLVASCSWYGTVSQPIELNGPTRYHWDNAFFAQAIDSRLSYMQSDGFTLSLAYDELPEKLLVFDYIGSNPSKGGLFRSGPVVKGDGIITSWIGHPEFLVGSIPVTARRIPSFFETFPVLLLDKVGSLRADIAFRRSSSRYSIEQVGVVCFIFGGRRNGSQLYSSSLVKTLARKSQFGSIFEFDRRSIKSDGVYRTTIRGWFTFSHITLVTFFLLGHLWHASRSFFKDLWTGVSINTISVTSEYGYNEKLGDRETKSSSFYF
jgi:photosystem II CP47 chlorophyll apoprotein